MSKVLRPKCQSLLALLYTSASSQLPPCLAPVRFRILGNRMHHPVRAKGESNGTREVSDTKKHSQQTKSKGCRSKWQVLRVAVSAVLCGSTSPERRQGEPWDSRHPQETTLPWGCGNQPTTRCLRRHSYLGALGAHGEKERPSTSSWMSSLNRGRV